MVRGPTCQLELNDYRSSEQALQMATHRRFENGDGSGQGFERLRAVQLNRGCALPDRPQPANQRLTQIERIARYFAGFIEQNRAKYRAVRNISH